MVNVKELERRWFQYKIKRYLPITIILVLLFIGIIIYFFTSQSTNTQKALKSLPLKVEKKTVPKILKATKHNQSNKNNTSTHFTTSKSLEPSFEFLNKMKYNEIVPQQQVSTQKKQHIKKHRKAPQPTQKVPEEKTIHIPPIKTIKKEKKSNLKIKTKQISESEIQDILQRFKKTNNPNLSLFVAKKYYELGNYNKAYNYALITNEIDNTMEESWLVFSKSLVKLGYKQRAIKTLQTYINYSHSSQAKILLNKITTGKFK